MSLRLTVEYDGTGFCGFQWQPGLRTVAGVLEEALTRLLGEPIKITGAGRTDGGVHATGQVVSLATPAPFAFERLPPALNALLPADCSLREAAVVEEGFSARFSATERTYVYAIHNRARRSALLARYAWHVPYALDVAAMQAAAAQALGERDFRSFCASGDRDPAAPTTRRVSHFTASAAGELVRIEITANAFLHRMVRTLVGTLVECGRGRRAPDGMAAIFAAADRSAAGPVAPPQGLFLAGVRYLDGYDSFAEPPVFGAAATRLDGARAFP